jgi:two-component system NtrC family response regulator
MARILVINKNERFRALVSEEARKEQHSVTGSPTLQEGVRRARSGAFDVVFLSTSVPAEDWKTALESILNTPSAPEVIVTTVSFDPTQAARAFGNGAWDYIEKSFCDRDIMSHVNRALAHRSRKTHLRPSASLKPETLQEIVGQSPRMRLSLDLLAQAAKTDTTVLITGETGTGKEVFAGAIHANSRRAEKNFVVVDCAAMPETLVESTLFGHEKGAFTGADRAQKGLVYQADGGTLFLDEVGELPLAVQRVFLRFLQEHSFRSVGGHAEIHSNFRLIAATNRDLKEAVRLHLFREDLYFRLSSFIIDLPALRERKEDIRSLVEYYMGQLLSYRGVEKKEFSPEFFDVLMRYDWPGNVRELFNTLERVLVVAHDDPVIYPMHLPPSIRIETSKGRDDEDDCVDGVTRTDAEPPAAFPPFKEMRDNAVFDLESSYFKSLFSLTDGNIQEICRISGLSRSRLYSILKKHRISPSALRGLP